MPGRSRTPEFAVIGLGRFGESLARALIERGHSVLGVDVSSAITQQLSQHLTQVVALDATDAEALRDIGIAQFDTVVVAIGTNFEANVMTTVTLKELGVRHIVCKALSEKQRHVLLRVGADRVVLPEQDGGRWLARSLVMPDVFGQLELGSHYSVIELTVPPTLIGQSVQSAALRQRFGVTLLAVKCNHSDELLVSPSAEYQLRTGDLLVLVGDTADIERLTKSL